MDAELKEFLEAMERRLALNGSISGLNRWTSARSFVLPVIDGIDINPKREMEN